MSAGKGDKPRPINKKTFDKNFDDIKWNKSSIKNQKNKKSKIIYTYK